MFWLILKIVIALFFLIAFLRRPTFSWGIGLLAVTTAVLLDTILGTFGRDEMAAELGFFFYVIAGGLLGSMTLWAFAVLRPLIERDSHAPINQSPKKRSETGGTAVDRAMLFQEIHTRLTPEEIRDLIFDLEYNENDLIGFQQTATDLIHTLMDKAEEDGKLGSLALAVERILTPMPPENLPRLEKIGTDSPRTILRHYLLAHYTNEQLAQLASSLSVEWEQLAGASKKDKVRSFLLHLYHRNRIQELIQQMKQS